MTSFRVLAFFLPLAMPILYVPPVDIFLVASLALTDISFDPLLADLDRVAEGLVNPGIQSL